MYEMTRTVKCSDIGSDSKMKNSAVVDFLQDCSMFHLDGEPVMSPFFKKENCIMFLVSRQVDILKKPEYSQRVKVKTWVTELTKLYGTRNTVIYDEKGEPCCLCTAVGAFMSRDTMKPMFVPQELVERVEKLPPVNMEMLSRKIKLPKTEPVVYENVPVLKHYIDMYNHVNNARYVDMTDEYVKNVHDVKRIRIEYKKPLKYGEYAQARVFENGNITTVDICSKEGKPYCVCEYTF